MKDIKVYDYNPGDSFKALIPFGYEPMKVHVMYVLDGIHRSIVDETRVEKYIVYKVYGKHKQWWHIMMEKESMMNLYRQQAEEWKTT